MPVIKSEKLGGGISGCGLSEKVETVPIKKRRFLFRSQSPPSRTTSPLLDKNETSFKSQSLAINSAGSCNDSDQIVNKEHHIGEKNLVRVNGPQDDNERLSGIIILAGAFSHKTFGADDGSAEDSLEVEESFRDGGTFEVLTNTETCSLSRGVPVVDPISTEILPEGTGTCISSVPGEEGSTSLSANGLSNDKSIECTYPLTSKDRERVRIQEFSSQDDRSHWDLNTAIDAWGHPFHYQNADSQSNQNKDISSYDKKGNSEGNELHGQHGRSTCHAEEELSLSDPKKIVDEVQQQKVNVNKLEISSDPDEPNCVQQKVLSQVIAANTGGSSACKYEDRSASSQHLTLCPAEISEGLSTDQVASFGPSADKTFPHNANYLSTCVMSTCLSQGNFGGASGCAAITGMTMEKQAVVPSVALSGDVTCEIRAALDKDTENDNGISDLHDDKDALMDIISSDTCKPEETVLPRNPTHLLDEVVLSNCSPLALQMSMPGLVVGEQPTLPVDTKIQEEKVSVHNTAEPRTPMHGIGEEPAMKSSDKLEALLPPSSVSNLQDLCKSIFDDQIKSSDRILQEKPTENGYDSKTSHHDCGPVEEDRGSQYEDGEVRESMFHAWEEYDAEDLEAEHVDYGSDNAYNLGPDTEHLMNDLQEDFTESSLRALEDKDSRNEVNALKFVARTDNLTDSRMKTSGWDQRGHNSPVIALGRKNVDGDCMHGHDVKDAETRMVGSRGIRRAPRSHINRQASDHVFLGKDKPCLRESSDAGDLKTRSEKESGHGELSGRGRYIQHARDRGDRNVHSQDSPRGRYVRHAHDRGDCGVHSPDSPRGLKRHSAPNYHKSKSFRCNGPQKGAIGRRTMDASSPGVHRRLPRNRSPAHRDEGFSFHVGVRPARELSPGRYGSFGRGRSLNYGPQLEGRGPRGKYHRSIPDDNIEPSFYHSHSSAKRERSSFPFERRGNPHAHWSRTSSPSRSGTHSPKFGNLSVRHQDESPNFRAGVRRLKARLPHQQPAFLADDMVGFSSMPRSHGSPSHNSRCTGNRKDEVAPFWDHACSQGSSNLDQKSSHRFSLRDDRLDFVDSSRDRSRRPRRFSEMRGVGVGRGLRYRESDDDRREHGFRYRMFNPTKQHDVDKALKVSPRNANAEDGSTGPHNSHYHDDASFRGRESPENYYRGTGSRIDDVPRRYGGSNSQSSGMRRCNE